MSGRDGWETLYSRDPRPWKGDQTEVLDVSGPVLELGVGNGKGLSMFAPNAYPVGLDFSRSALLSCKIWHDIPLVQGDVTALPFKDGSFPFISVSHVLGHMLEEERGKASREIARVLLEGGRIFVNVFGDEDMRCGHGTEVEERTYERGNGILCHYFRDGEVEGLFPDMIVERSWERRVDKRYHGKSEVRQERRIILRCN